MKKDLNYYAKKSINARSSKSLECDVTLMVDGEKFHAYEVSIASQDLLFLCAEGTATYLVDTYLDNVTGKTEVLGVELFDWSKDEAV